MFTLLLVDDKTLLYNGKAFILSDASAYPHTPRSTLCTACRSVIKVIYNHNNCGCDWKGVHVTSFVMINFNNVRKYVQRVAQICQCFLSIVYITPIKTRSIGNNIYVSTHGWYVRIEWNVRVLEGITILQWVVS